MNSQRIPSGPLQPFIQLLWYSESAGHEGVARERVLPTGAMHMVLRLNDAPLRVYANVTDLRGDVIGSAIIGGARSSYYVRDVSQASCAVGVMLAPGAAWPLFGVPAHELAGSHTPLDLLWGFEEVERIREHIRAKSSPQDKLAAFEQVLASRLPRVRGVHPAVAHALVRFDRLPDDASSVRRVVDETGYSHRRFITLFREALGLTPKRYCRVRRLQHVLSRLKSAEEPDLAALAVLCGYSDQAHFTHEFRELAGLTPGSFRKLALRHTHHVPLQR